MLAKAPQDRPASPSAVIDTLAPFCEGSKLIGLLREARRKEQPAAESEASRVETGELRGSMDVETSRDASQMLHREESPGEPLEFDPYHRWLGIPREEQPANYYRLLGVVPFEGDAEVIRDAAARQMAHVRTYHLGQHAELSQRILNELAAAKACLLNARKKAVYDVKLREELGPAVRTHKPVSGQPEVAAVVPAMSGTSLEIRLPRISPTRRPLAKRRVLSGLALPSKPLIGVAVGAMFLVILFGIVLSMRTREGTLVVEIDDPEATVQVLGDEEKILIQGKGDKGKLILGVDPGKRRLRVEKDGMVLFAQDFSIAPGGKETIRARLETPIPQKATASADPTGPPPSSAAPSIATTSSVTPSLLPSPKESGLQPDLVSEVDDPAGNLVGDASRRLMDIVRASVAKRGDRYEFTVQVAEPFPTVEQFGENKRVDFILHVDIDRNRQTGQTREGNDYNIHITLCGRRGWYGFFQIASAVAESFPPMNFRDVQVRVDGATATLSFPMHYLPSPTFDWYAGSMSDNSPDWLPKTRHPSTARATFPPQPKLMSEAKDRTGSLETEVRLANLVPEAAGTPSATKPVPPWDLPAGSPPPAVAPFDAATARRHQERWAKHLGVPVELENSIGMKFVLIPPGEFDMGSTDEEVASLLQEAKATKQPGYYIGRLPSEAPEHRVRITKPFWLCRHEVTRGQFRQFVDDRQYQAEAERDGKGGFGRLAGSMVSTSKIRVSCGIQKWGLRNPTIFLWET